MWIGINFIVFYFLYDMIIAKKKGMFIIKNYRLIIVLIFSILFLLVSCEKKERVTDQNSDEITETKNNDETKNNPIITYTEYQSLFEELVNKLEIPGYSLENSSLGDDIIRIDKDLSFGKREFLTTDGLFSGHDIESTQETMFFLNKNKERLLTITISYTKSFIGNDLVFYNSNEGYGLNEDLINNDLLTISYKNLLFTILQTSNAQVTMDDTVYAGLSIVGILEKM